MSAKSMLWCIADQMQDCVAHAGADLLDESP
jgi:hypothetical protein